MLAAANTAAIYSCSDQHAPLLQPNAVGASTVFSYTNPPVGWGNVTAFARSGTKRGVTWQGDVGPGAPTGKARECAKKKHPGVGEYFNYDREEEEEEAAARTQEQGEDAGNTRNNTLNTSSLSTMSISERARHKPCRTFSTRDFKGESLVWGSVGVSTAKSGTMNHRQKRTRPLMGQEATASLHGADILNGRNNVPAVKKNHYRRDSSYDLLYEFRWARMSHSRHHSRQCWRSNGRMSGRRRR